MKGIDLPPSAPILMESTRAIGYTLESAVADVIDNSLTAAATNVGIWFMPFNDPYVAILDNGIGMTQERLIEAMRYGSDSPLEDRAENDMGRYGLGMKTASLSQCRCLSVITLINGKMTGCRWDLEHIRKIGKWDLLLFDDAEIMNFPMIEKLMKHGSGTLVLWNNLDKLVAGEVTLEQALDSKMVQVREHLSLVFHRFLSGEATGKKVAMSINGNNIEPKDPFFTSKSTIVMDDEYIDIRGSKVVVRPYILPHPSNMTKDELEKHGGKDGLRKLQGYYVYRNKRLIIRGTWFKIIKMDEFSKLARVRVDIPNSLDDLWTLDIKKSAATPPEIVRKNLKRIINIISNSSRKTWTFRKRKELDDAISHVWDRMETREGIRYFINQDHPLIELINEKLSQNDRVLLRQYIETIQNNLPLNTLHSDIHNEVKIAQDDENTEKKRVCELARVLLKDENNENIHKVYERLMMVEPFRDYSVEIKKILQEVEKYD